MQLVQVQKDIKRSVFMMSKEFSMFGVSSAGRDVRLMRYM